MNFSQNESPDSVSRAATGLIENGITVIHASSGADAKQKALALIPLGAEVMTMSSITLETLGITAEINDSGKYNSVKNKLKDMSRETQGLEMQKIGSAPEWAIGSVHAVTETGQVVIVSNTGSQLPGYAYGSAHVIWIVGTQKIVPNVATGLQRANEYILPLESERLAKIYNKPGLKSNVSKVLIFNKEIVPGRVTLIFVPEVVGF